MATIDLPDDPAILTALRGALWNAAHYHYGIIHVAEHDGAHSINLSEEQIAVCRTQAEWLFAAAERISQLRSPGRQ